MQGYKIIKTQLKDINYKLFEDIPKKLYKKDSQRFVLGFEPVETHLEACYVLLKDKEPVGRFSFYENSELKYKDKPAASIGSYECINDAEASKALLNYAISLAKSKNYKWLLGPMEGSTWNNYRFSNQNDYQNFFLEPYHHLYYNNQFVDNGFSVISKYFSNLDTALLFDEKKNIDLGKYFIEKGLVLRSLDVDNFEEDLFKIGELSNKAFSANFLYTPIKVDEFVKKYKNLGNLFSPKLIWIAEDQQGDIQAFIFAVEDYNDTSGKTVIIKSVARLKSSIFKGIGSYLSGKVIQLSKKMGYTRIIHAFMIADNNSVQMSEEYVVNTFKHYALYGKKI